MGKREAKKIVSIKKCSDIYTKDEKENLGNNLNLQSKYNTEIRDSINFCK